VAKLPDFQHSGQPGAFRSWLRQVMVHCLANFRRARQAQPGTMEALEQLQDPHSELSRLWDQEHNQHVAAAFLRLVEGKFEPTTYRAFRGVVLEGKRAADVAAGLGMSVNAVRLAKSHVLRWLREASRGLLD
jgi:RNA polymerase sigma-70 factor (ECF subfamily)